jgi:hypothetical protein
MFTVDKKIKKQTDKKYLKNKTKILKELEELTIKQV